MKVVKAERPLLVVVLSRSFVAAVQDGVIVTPPVNDWRSLDKWFVKLKEEVERSGESSVLQWPARSDGLPCITDRVTTYADLVLLDERVK